MTNEELVYNYQNGDNQVLEEIIKNNTGIVYKIANKYYLDRSNSLDKEDLIQEGFIGLMLAAKKYDFNYENKSQFITYAVFWINSKINRYVRQYNTNYETSINITTSEDKKMELIDCIQDIDNSLENVEDKIYNMQLRKDLEKAMLEANTLQEREILKFRYGWDSNKEMKFQEIGDIFNITQSRAKQIEERSLRKIRDSKWGRIKAIEIHGNKKESNIYNIPGTIVNLNFAEKYLSIYGSYGVDLNE
ncbi:MAG: sigma-70 family RNA polymerase sigma factor [Clostridiaceae bacterium]